MFFYQIMLQTAIASELPHLARFAAAPGGIHNAVPRAAVAVAARTTAHNPRMLALLLPIATST